MRYLALAREALGILLIYLVVLPCPEASSGGERLRIEAENYVSGGEGVGFHIKTRTKRGSAYRPDDAGITRIAGASHGYAVTRIQSGEWLRYRAELPRDGVYLLEFGVASAEVGGLVQVVVDGTDMTGSMEIPRTGSPTTFRVLIGPAVVLSGGSHTLKVRFEGRDAAFDYLDLQWTQMSPPPAFESQSVDPDAGLEPVREEGRPARSGGLN